MFLLFWIRQQFSSLTASHSWRLFLVVCCLLGVIDATSINNRAVFSEKSFCKPCSQSLQSGGGRKEMKEGRKEGKDWGKKEQKKKKKTRGKESKGRKRKGRKKGRNWRPFIMPVLVLSESPWPR